MNSNKDPDTIYEDIMAESLILKLSPLEKYICEVKEELIEYNPHTNQIICYSVVVERASNSLSNILDLWTSNQRQHILKREALKEYFSKEKLAAIFYNAVYALNYLHSKDIFYSDMKPDNLLVFRDFSVKLGDFGITCKLDSREKNFDAVSFVGKGCTDGFIKKDAKDKIANGDLFSKNEMFGIDIYALQVTFKKAIDRVKLISGCEQEETYFSRMLTDLKTLTLKMWLDKWTPILINDKTFISSLQKQFRAENKLLALKNLQIFSPYYYQIEDMGYALRGDRPEFQETFDLYKGEHYIVPKNYLDFVKELEISNTQAFEAIIDLMQSFNPEYYPAAIKDLYDELNLSLKVHYEVEFEQIEISDTKRKSSKLNCNEFKTNFEHLIRVGLIGNDLPQTSLNSSLETFNLVSDNFECLSQIALLWNRGLFSEVILKHIIACDAVIDDRDQFLIKIMKSVISSKFKTSLVYLAGIKLSKPFNDLAQYQFQSKSLSMKAQRKIIKEFSAASEQNAHFLLSLSEKLQAQNDYENAIECCREGLQIFIQQFGEAASYSVKAYCFLSKLYFQKPDRTEDDLQWYQKYQLKFILCSNQNYNARFDIWMSILDVYQNTKSNPLAQAFIDPLEFGSLIVKDAISKHYGLRTYSKILPFSDESLSIINHSGKFNELGLKFTTQFKELCNIHFSEESKDLPELVERNDKANSHFVQDSDYLVCFDDLEILAPYLQENDWRHLPQLIEVVVIVLKDTEQIVGIQTAYRSQAGKTIWSPERGSPWSIDSVYRYRFSSLEIGPFTNFEPTYGENGMHSLSIQTASHLFIIGKVDDFPHKCNHVIRAVKGGISLLKKQLRLSFIKQQPQNSDTVLDQTFRVMKQCRYGNQYDIFADRVQLNDEYNIHRQETSEIEFLLRNKAGEVLFKLKSVKCFYIQSLDGNFSIEKYHDPSNQYQIRINSDQTIYSGSSQEFQAHGFGILVDKNQKILKVGEWKNGAFHFGWVQEVSIDEQGIPFTSFKGFMKDDQKHFFGTEYYPNKSTKLEGMFFESLKHGLVKTFAEDGKLLKMEVCHMGLEMICGNGPAEYNQGFEIRYGKKTNLLKYEGFSEFGNIYSGHKYTTKIGFNKVAMGEFIDGQVSGYACLFSNQGTLKTIQGSQCQYSLDFGPEYEGSFIASSPLWEQTIRDSNPSFNQNKLIESSKISFTESLKYPFGKIYLLYSSDFSQQQLESYLFLDDEYDQSLRVNDHWVFGAQDWLIVYSLPDLKCINKIYREGELIDVCFNSQLENYKDNQIVVVSSRVGSLYIFDIKTGASSKVAIEFKIRRIKHYKEDLFLCQSSDEEQIKLIDISTNKVVGELSDKWIYGNLLIQKATPDMFVLCGKIEKTHRVVFLLLSQKENQEFSISLESKKLAFDEYWDKELYLFEAITTQLSFVVTNYNAYIYNKDSQKLYKAFDRGNSSIMKVEGSKFLYYMHFSDTKGVRELIYDVWSFQQFAPIQIKNKNFGKALIGVNNHSLYFFCTFPVRSKIWIIRILSQLKEQSKKQNLKEVIQQWVDKLFEEYGVEGVLEADTGTENRQIGIHEFKSVMAKEWQALNMVRKLTDEDVEDNLSKFMPKNGQKIVCKVEMSKYLWTQLE